MQLSFLQKKVVAFILLISCINLFMGCHRYFRPVAINATTIETKQATIKKLSDENRYFILRKGTNSYTLTNVILDQSKLTLTADISDVPAEHRLYLRQNKKPVYKYSKGKKEDIVLTEVHLYSADTSPLDISKPYTFSLSDIQKIELIEFDKQRTSSSYVWGTIGIAVGAALVVVLIAALSKPEPAPTPPPSSCPYVSTLNSEGYKLQGEIYSAAIYPALQKDDYLPIQMEPVGDSYSLKISNELQEIQYTDFADLMVVEHAKGIKLLIDPNGKLYSIEAPQSPIAAMLNNKIDVKDELLYKDSRSCFFKDDNSNKASEDLFITFKNDSKSTKGKLILNAKSSSWLNYLYGEFTKGFGNYYTKWSKEQEKKPAAELQKWSEDQNIPLTVSVKTDNGWKEIQKIKTIGPLLHRDIVIPVELTGQQSVEFKISGGYMFWDLDYAAIDYSPDADFTVKTIKPYEAINEHNTNVLSDIINADKKYLNQPNIGDATIIKYKSVERTDGMAQTFFLHSSGYYKYIRNYTGTPKVAFLKSFEQPGALSAYSRQKFSAAWNNIATAKN